jgi:hypothetical protein
MRTTTANHVALAHDVEPDDGTTDADEQGFERIGEFTVVVTEDDPGFVILDGKTPVRIDDLLGGHDERRGNASSTEQ